MENGKFRRPTSKHSIVLFVMIHKKPAKIPFICIQTRHNLVRP